MYQTPTYQELVDGFQALENLKIIIIGMVITEPCTLKEAFTSLYKTEPARWEMSWLIALEREINNSMVVYEREA